MMHRSVRRCATVAAIATGAVTLLAGVASAHVTVNPERVAQGDYAKLEFRVPDESDTASTVKLTVSFPKDSPLASVRVKPHDGWRVDVTKTKLTKPVTAGDFTLDEAVTSITWTAKSGSRIAPGEFEEFEVSVGPLPTKPSLSFPAVQTYDNGDVVRWNQQVKEGGAEPEHPAPTLTLVKGGADQQSGGGSGHTEDAAAMGPSASEPTPGQASTVDSTARILGGAALGVGVLCLAAAIGALLRGRRSNA